MKDVVFRPVVIALLAAAATTSPAGAQLTPQPPTFGNYTNAFASDGTPAMRRERLEQANALRAEAARLQASDGGVLSPTHAAYLRERANIIIGKPRGATGSLIERR